MKTTLKILFLSGLIGMMAFGCRKEKIIPRHNSNITLYDKPLSVIQHYITGNWELQYAVGGLAGGKYVDTSNYYMILSPDHIITGNDLSGVFVDTKIVWVKAKDLFRDTPYTYLLSYSIYGLYREYIPYRIKNDTLIITDYSLSDGFSYYYTKH